MQSPLDDLERRGKKKRKKKLVQARYRMDCLACAKFT